MQKLVDGLALYHGSFIEVSQPDLRRCARGKDFGRGFYLTTSRSQAQSFARLTLRKAHANGTAAPEQTDGVVSRFVFHTPQRPLAIMHFDTADAEWLHCVVAHRKRGAFPEVCKACEPYDVIAGKIANDQTNATIAAYMADTFGPLGSARADEICISLLLPERLVDQFCFRSEQALACLEFEGSERV